MKAPEISISKKINAQLHKLKEKAGLYFYTKSQSYDVVYEAVVTNLDSKENFVQIILPVPPQTEYQKFQKSPSFSPENCSPSPNTVTAVKARRTLRSLGEGGCNEASENFALDLLGHNLEKLHLLKRETKYGNSYVLWEAKLAAGGEIKVSESFSAYINPVNFSGENYLMSDYQDILTSDNYQKYIAANKFLNIKSESCDKIFHSLYDGREQSVLKIVRSFYNYIRDSISYGKPIDGLYSADDAFLNECVDCGGFATALGTLCLKAKIPVRVVSGFWAGYQQNAMHSWLEILMPDNSWLAVDPASDSLFLSGRNFKSGSFGFLGSDRITLSFGCDMSVELKDGIVRRTDILQNPIVVASNGNESIKVKSEFTPTPRNC